MACPKCNDDRLYYWDENKDKVGWRLAADEIADVLTFCPFCGLEFPVPRIHDVYEFAKDNMYIKIALGSKPSEENIAHWKAWGWKVICGRE